MDGVNFALLVVLLALSVGTYVKVTRIEERDHDNLPPQSCKLPSDKPRVCNAG